MDLQFGSCSLKMRERQLVGPGGPVELSARGFDILRTLLAHANEIVSKDALLEAAWPGLAVEENTLQVHISALRKALGPDMIATVHGRGYKYAGPAPVTATAAVPQGTLRGTEGAGHKPTVAVLPFANLSGDPEQQYFSDGITDDIIDRLTRFRVIAVIGHQSSFALRGRSLPEVRDRLAADYVLTGSVRKSGDRIRIAARLSDARSENAIWAEHYDRPLADVFALQDEVTGVIASTLMGRVEIDVAMRPSADGARLSSYELVLQGIFHFKKLTLQSMAMATGCFERAIATHSGNAEAHRYLAVCYMAIWWNDFVPEGLPKSLATAERAVALDPASGSCHQALAICRLWADSLDGATRSNARSLELNPGDPDALIETGVIRAYAGDLAGARTFTAEAFRLNPLPPLWYAEFRAIADFVDGRYAEALPAFEAIPYCAYDNMYVLACLGHLGEAGRARQLLQHITDAGRAWDFMAGAAREPYRDSEPRNRLIEGLRRALAF